MIEGYGLSETSPVATVNPTNATAYSGSIGLPLPSTDVAILDDEGREVPLGERGEVGEDVRNRECDGRRDPLSEAASRMHRFRRAVVHE